MPAQMSDLLFMLAQPDCRMSKEGVMRKGRAYDPIIDFVLRLYVPYVPFPIYLKQTPKEDSEN